MESSVTLRSAPRFTRVTFSKKLQVSVDSLRFGVPTVAT